MQQQQQQFAVYLLYNEFDIHRFIYRVSKMHVAIDSVFQTMHISPVTESCNVAYFWANLCVRNAHCCIVIV